MMLAGVIFTEKQPHSGGDVACIGTISRTFSLPLPKRGLLRMTTLSRGAWHIRGFHPSYNPGLTFNIGIKQ
jgi:hypothetical protein